MSKKRFDGQVAIITGAGVGIGFEIARQLCLEGCKVILNDINQERCETAVHQIQEEGGQCLPVVGDSSDLNLIQKMVDTAVSEFGHLDMAIANAGITTFGDFFDYSIDQFERLVRVNLQGTFFLIQKAAHQMREQGSGGRILLISSTTAHQSHLYLSAYGMTKAGTEALARGLVYELAPHKISINAIAPGATVTNRNLQNDPNYVDVWSKLIPLGKVAQPFDIANAALFMLDPKSNHITGQALVIDGGWTAVSPGPDIDFSGGTK